MQQIQLRKDRAFVTSARVLLLGVYFPDGFVPDTAICESATRRPRRVAILDDMSPIRLLFEAAGGQKNWSGYFLNDFTAALEHWATRNWATF